MITHEEFKEKWYDDRLEEIKDDIDDSWRHGNNHNTVYKDEETGLYYMAWYRVSGDGEYHGIRDNEFEITEVEPYTETVVVTKWRKKK